MQATGRCHVTRSASSAVASGARKRLGRDAYGVHGVAAEPQRGAARALRHNSAGVGAPPQRTATWNTFSASGTDGGPPLFTSRAPARMSHVSTRRQRCAAWQRRKASAKGFVLSRVAAGGRTQGGEEARRVAHSALRFRLGRVDQDRNQLRPAEWQRRRHRAPSARQRQGTNARSACRRCTGADTAAAALLRTQRREARAVRSAPSRVSALQRHTYPSGCCAKTDASTSNCCVTSIASAMAAGRGARCIFARYNWESCFAPASRRFSRCLREAARRGRTRRPGDGAAATRAGRRGSHVCSRRGQSAGRRLGAGRCCAPACAVPPAGAHARPVARSPCEYCASLRVAGADTAFCRARRALAACRPRSALSRLAARRTIVWRRRVAVFRCVSPRQHASIAAFAFCRQASAALLSLFRGPRLPTSPHAVTLSFVRQLCA